MRTVNWNEVPAKGGELTNHGAGNLWSIQGECKPTQAAVFTGTGLTDPNGVWKLDLATGVCLKGANRVISILLTPTYYGEIHPDLKFFPHLSAAIGATVQVVVKSTDEHWVPKGLVPFSWLIVAEGNFG